MNRPTLHEALNRLVGLAEGEERVRGQIKAAIDDGRYEEVADLLRGIQAERERLLAVVSDDNLMVLTR